MCVIEEFPLTALSCPYGPKLKTHVGNLSEELSVIFILWSLFSIETFFRFPTITFGCASANTTERQFRQKAHKI